MLKGGEPYFLTAGHCTEAIDAWSATLGGQEIGSTAGSSFPGNDYGLVQYTADVAHPSEVDLYNGTSQTIAQAGDASVGQTVQRSGSTTHVHSGTVTGVNATVNYQEGTVTGMIRTTVCSEPGDSGGSLFAGDTALGLTSGGSGDCFPGRGDLLPAGARGPAGIRGPDRLRFLPSRTISSPGRAARTVPPLVPGGGISPFGEAVLRGCGGVRGLRSSAIALDQVADRGRWG